MNALCKEEGAQTQVNQLSTQLQKLIDQLNQFKPASERSVGEVHGKMFEEFQQHLELQSKGIDKVNDTIVEAQKTAQNNAELLQTLLVGMEIWVRVLNDFMKI